MFSMRPLLQSKPDLPPSLRDALTRTDCDALLALVDFGLQVDEAAELLDLAAVPHCARH
jgi:hypothetical protein